MTILGEHLNEIAEKHIRQAADQIASQLCADVYDDEAPPAFHKHVEDTAFEYMTEALHEAQVADIAEFGADVLLTEAADRDRERALSS